MSRTLPKLSPWRKDENGQSLLITALALGMLSGFLGLAVDIGHMRAVRRHMQTAADAAALAAGLELRVCGSTPSCTAQTAAVSSALQENGFSGTTVVPNCGSSNGTSVLQVNTPPCALGTADPNAGKSGYVEAVFRRSVPTYFARVIGLRAMTITARSEVRRAGAPCVYALSQSADSAISIAAGLSSTCGIVDESSSAKALSCSAGQLSAPLTKIAGGSAALLCSTAGVVRTGAPLPTPADPLGYLPVPNAPACGSSVASPYHGSATQVIIATGNVVLYPDKAYCGGIKITGAATTVTFMPGTYVLKSTSALNGGLSIDLLATVVGSAVTFYNAGPSGSFSVGLTGTGAGKTTLAAPSSGTYSGVLLFQDPADTAGATLSLASATGVQLQGALYLPSAALSYAAATPGAYTVLVAKTLSFTAASTLTSNFASLANGSPVNADNVQVVE